jgi:tetratricopeptide (TPR) repeat protein
MSEGYEIVSLDEIEIPGLANTARWASIRRHFGIESFGVNAWSADAGGDVIGEHDEVSGGAAQHEELYVVLSGKATFTVDGETVDGTAGTIVFVRDPTVKRKAVADEAGTRILAVGAKRGEAFVPSPWERSAPAFPFFASKEYDKAIDVLEAAHAEYPDDATVLYNLACAESMSGRTAEALEHLRRSVEGGERFRELARTDSDFDPIRDEPGFAEIVGPS